MNRRLLVMHATQSSSMCRRSCCWTPFGHSGVAVNCDCHSLDEFSVAAEVNAQQIADALAARPQSKYLTQGDLA